MYREISERVRNVKGNDGGIGTEDKNMEEEDGGTDEGERKLEEKDGRIGEGEDNMEETIKLRVPPCPPHTRMYHILNVGPVLDPHPLKFFFVRPHPPRYAGVRGKCTYELTHADLREADFVSI